MSYIWDRTVRTVLIKTVEDPPRVHQVIPGGVEIKQQGDELTVQCPACGTVTALVREAGVVGNPVAIGPPTLWKEEGH
jgi:hypothetical protein